MCNDCPICLEPLDFESNYLRLTCKHHFHFNCIFSLLATNKQYNNKCPMCRNNIIQEVDRVSIIDGHLKILIDQNIFLSNTIQSLQKENKFITIFMIFFIILFLAYATMFYATNFHIFIDTLGFFVFIMSYVIYPFIFIIQKLSYIFITMYPLIITFFILTVFTILSISQNGFPFISNY